ncbi:MAG: neutral zinc metallopeptidase [Actinobacteria bacterium]|nr:neutral zinc metallopeptidase [Actinomycetota bacterium]
MSVRRMAALSVVMAAALGGCGVSTSGAERATAAGGGPGAAGSTYPRSSTTTGSSTTAPGTSNPDVANDPVLKKMQADLESLTQTLDDYWAGKVDGYQPPQAVETYLADGSSTVTCGGRPVTGPNAAFCGSDNTVLVAIDWFYEQNQKIGDTFTYFVLAHEWGHSAQANLGVPDNPNIELQADCFAGAFLQDEIDAGQLTEEPGDEQELNQSIALASNDFGTKEKHGTLAQRATAVEYGRTNRGQACVSQYGPG